MEPKLNRRTFLSKSTKAGVAACALACCPMIAQGGVFSGLFSDDDIPDPKKLTYCGFICKDDCKFMVASIKNDSELKKEVYDEWKMKENHNIDFDPDKIFCFGCKNEEKPMGILLQKCTVRACVIEKNHDCCIECKELTDCEKDLWSRFPEFKKQVIGMQQKYFESKG